MQNATIFITIWARKNPRLLAGVVEFLEALVVVEPVVPAVLKERSATALEICLWKRWKSEIAGCDNQANYHDNEGDDTHESDLGGNCEDQ